MGNSKKYRKAVLEELVLDVKYGRLYDNNHRPPTDLPIIEETVEEEEDIVIYENPSFFGGLWGMICRLNFYAKCGAIIFSSCGLGG